MKSAIKHRIIILTLIFIHFSPTPVLPSSSNYDDNPDVVTCKELLEVMQLQVGYDPTATTNALRFHAEIMLELARRAIARNPMGPPLLIKHEVWFHTFLEFTKLTKDEAPIYSKRIYEYRQERLIEYRVERVIEKVKEGREPLLALNVRLWWPKTPNGPKKYSFHDTLSTPKLKVTHRREITYRLLDFGNMIVYDKIRGLSGKPTSGPLKIILAALGEAAAKEFRIVIADNGLQILRAKMKKLFITKTTTVKVSPNGHTVPLKGLDLMELKERINEKIKIEYVPIKFNSS